LKNTSAGAQSPARYITAATWHKLPDLQVHAREVVIDGSMTVIELRDFIVSTGQYGRGIWFADSPQARDLLDAVSITPAMGGRGRVPAAGPDILATIPKSPGAVAHLRAINIDGVTCLEFREHRGGDDLRGYWTPFDAKAECLLHVLGASAAMKAVS
jgi:hypothetical protein